MLRLTADFILFFPGKKTAVTRKSSHDGSFGRFRSATNEQRTDGFKLGVLELNLGSVINLLPYFYKKSA